MALHSKKGFSASQTKRTSQRMNDSYIGTHVERPAGRHARGAHASKADQTIRVDFSDTKRSRRADRGVVEHVGVQSRSRETDADYARRRSRRGYVEDLQVKSRRQRFATLGIAALIVLIIAVGAGISAYFYISDSRLSLNDSNAQNALVAAEEGQPYYVLCTANLTPANQKQVASDDAYQVVRIDEQNKILTFISVPSHTQVTLSDGNTHPLYDAESVGGDSELITAVAELLGVDIAHFTHTDAAGLENLVDLVGGVTVDVAQEIDDPTAGTSVLKAGTQKLDAAQALTLLRASNYSTPYETQALMRATFSVNLATQAISGEGLSFASLVSDAAADVSTDWTSSQLIALGDALRPLNDATVYSCVLPGSEVAKTDDSPALYKVSSEDLTALMEAVTAGKSPDEAQGNIASLDRTKITVEVQNGSGITGAAARCAELLEAKGYQVGSVGNSSDGAVFKETLVIYKDEAYKTAAKAIVSDLNTGRVVDGGDYYSFSTNVLVVIGSDWVG